MSWFYVLPFVLATAISLMITPVVRQLAVAIGAIDLPDNERKLHGRPVAYLGGVAIFLGFLIPVLIFLPLTRHLLGLLAGITLLLVVGVVDDIRGLSPWSKLPWQIVAAMVVLAGGIGIVQFTNPLGGVIHLDYGRFAVNLAGLHFHITPIANLLSLLWLVGMVNVINFLDGLDGLASGVSGIAAFIMFLLAVSARVNQPEVALISIVLAGAALGFLPYNFYPARIFLGDGGAYFLGLTLALLAIYSGGKLATAGLVLGFTIFDGVWVALRRLYRRTSPFKADRQHFHHLLVEAGFSQRQAVLTLYAISLLFGLVAVTTQSLGKLIGLIALFVIMASLTALLTFRTVQRRSERP
jgi:UDP-GlcNAc:undecaprenyl-phosphate GlcNAc-1-phosphate transferase